MMNGEENNGGTMLVLSLLYLCLTIHAGLQLKPRLCKSKIDSKGLFLLSVTTASALRLMCFLGLCLVDAGLFFFDDNARDYSKEGSSMAFYSKAIIVLFDLPDFMLVSTYVLLVLVWAECFLSSRRHWLSSREYKHGWHLAYLFFNTVLYGCQLLIYLCLFFSPRLNCIRLLYLVPALLTLLVPIAHFLLYVFMSLRFSGFPISSFGAAQRLRQIIRVTLVWTLGRVLWSLVILSTVLYNSSQQHSFGCSPQSPSILQQRRLSHCYQDFDDVLWHDASTTTTTTTTDISHTVSSSSYYAETIGPVAIIGLFLLTEICPVVFTLDTGLLNILDYDERKMLQPNTNNNAPPRTSRILSSSSSYYASIIGDDDDLSSNDVISEGYEDEIQAATEEEEA